MQQIVTSFFSWQFNAFSLHNRFSVRIVSRTVGIHILYPDIDTAYTEKVAGGIQNTASYQQIFDIDTRNAVVSGVENAVFDQRMHAAMQMYSVRASQAGHSSHRHIFAVVCLVQKVSAVPCRISFKQYVFTAREKYGVRSAVSLFSIGIVTVLTVDHRIHLSDNGNILLAVWV